AIAQPTPQAQTNSKSGETRRIDRSQTLATPRARHSGLFRRPRDRPNRKGDQHVREAVLAAMTSAGPRSPSSDDRPVLGARAGGAVDGEATSSSRRAISDRAAGPAHIPRRGDRGLDSESRGS